MISQSGVFKQAATLSMLLLAIIYALFTMQAPAAFSVSSLCLVLAFVPLCITKRGLLETIIKKRIYFISVILGFAMALLSQPLMISLGFEAMPANQKWSMFLKIFFVFVAFIFAFFIVLNSAVSFKPQQEKTVQSGFSKKVFWASLMVFSVALGALWYAFNKFKYFSTIDCDNQLQQITGQIQLVDVHSVAHTLVMKLLLAIKNDFAFVIFTHMLLICIVLAFFAEYLVRRGIPFWLATSLPVLFLVFSNANTYMYPWKDTYYTVCIAILVYYTIRIVSNDIKFGWVHSSLMGAAMAFALLMRKNGIIVLIGVAIFLVYKLIKTKNKMFITTLCVSLGCIVIINVLAYQVFGAEKSDKNGFAYAAFGTGICAVIGEDGEISAEQQQVIDEILPVDFIKANYHKGYPATLIWEQQPPKSDPEEFFKDPNNAVYNNFFVTSMAENKTELIKLYFGLLPKNFKIMAQNVVASTKSIWSTSVLYSYEKNPVIGMNFLFTHATQFILLMVASLYLLRKKRLANAFLMMMPVVLNTVSIAISAVTNELRYLQPMYMLFAPMLLMIIIWAREDIVLEQIDALQTLRKKGV